MTGRHETGLPDQPPQPRDAETSGDRSTIQRSPSAPADFRLLHVKPSGRRRRSPARSRREERRRGRPQRARRSHLNGVTVRNNHSSRPAGGLWSELSTLSLKNTTVRDDESFVGGGVAKQRDDADDETMRMNGGGIMTLDIANESGPLRLNSSRIRGNIAQGSGGGFLIGQPEPTLCTGGPSPATPRTAARAAAAIHNDGRLFGIYTISIPGPQQTTEAARAKQPLPIKSSVFKNTPDNWHRRRAPPGAMPSAPHRPRTRQGPTRTDGAERAAAARSRARQDPGRRARASFLHRRPKGDRSIRAPPPGPGR